MRIAITGATGLIGRSLVNALSSYDIDLTCLSRKVQKSNRVQWLQGDLRDEKIARAIVDGQDIIIHLANETIPLTSFEDSLGGIQSGILPTINLIDAARRSASCPYVIFLSSGGAVYGDAGPVNQLLSEKCKCEPLTEYGIHKLIIERLLHRAANEGYLRCSVLRVSNAYGALLDPERMQGLVGISVSRVLKGLPLRLIGNPANIRDYIHVDDIISAIHKSLNLKNNFSLINIGSGVGYTVSEVINLISRIGGSEKMERLDVKGSNLLAGSNVLDISYAKSVLDWVPKISLEDGVRKMFTSYLNHN